MKHEWRKKEKQLYIPSIVPQVVEVPKQQLDRCGTTYREIYLNDARKVEKSKSKTVLRYFVGRDGEENDENYNC